MTSLLSEPMASTIVVLDEVEDATLSEVARATGKPVSTIQRAVDRLLEAGVIERESPRGRLRFAPGAPRSALRELSDWRLGGERAETITKVAHATSLWPRPPRTIKNAAVRSAWPKALRAIVHTYHPAQVILFGSQARGDAAPDSDVDLLVVFDDQDLDRRERRVEIRRLLSGMPFAKDVLVASTDERDRVSAGTAIADAFQNGIIVYDR